jgi:hypothetical protein
VIPDSTSERGEEQLGLAGPSVPSTTPGWQQVCWCRDQSDPVLFNRNRRNRNFLPCGTGIVTCQKVGTGTVINYGSGTYVKWYHKSSHKHTE